MYALGQTIGKFEHGIYSIDTLTREITPIVLSKEVGIGIRNIVFGPDGKLYAIGSIQIPIDNGHFRYDYWLFRVDRKTFTKIASLPHSGGGLTVDQSGTFYTATSYSNSIFEVWMIKPSGKAVLLASELNHPWGIAYDATTRRLYVRDQEQPYTIHAIEIPLSVSPQGKLSTIWGLIKHNR